ncbi:TRAP transporter small permease [Amorphus orientalis]|uniref:TRAP transporter small permease protein n=1 Tax=Amorphus orientalis TaxID=649198 RepID=A0AAE3VSA2_9HYPH|nr:TRAP transporter small permease [Amorphus orientalis]MDQ0317859.1 TRAP-type C4-dicarboxylate transport system permease small subunit [Amorphus orientalis]
MFRILEHLLVLGMSVMSLMVLLNVVLRYGFNSGIPFSVEVSRLIFVWVVFVGSVVALKDGAHLSVSWLIDVFPRPVRLACFWVSHLLMLWCCWLLWQGSWVQTVVNLNNYAPISGISVGTMYAAGLFAAAFFALIILRNLWRSIRPGRSEEIRPDGSSLPARGEGDDR